MASEEIIKVKWKDLSFPLQLAALGGFWSVVQMVCVILFLILAVTVILGGM